MPLAPRRRLDRSRSRDRGRRSRSPRGRDRRGSPHGRYGAIPPPSASRRYAEHERGRDRYGGRYGDRDYRDRNDGGRDRRDDRYRRSSPSGVDDREREGSRGYRGVDERYEQRDGSQEQDESRARGRGTVEGRVRPPRDRTRSLSPRNSGEGLSFQKPERRQKQDASTRIGSAEAEAWFDQAIQKLCTEHDLPLPLSLVNEKIHEAHPRWDLRRTRFRTMLECAREMEQAGVGGVRLGRYEDGEWSIVNSSYSEGGVEMDEAPTQAPRGRKNKLVFERPPRGGARRTVKERVEDEPRYQPRQAEGDHEMQQDDQLCPPTDPTSPRPVGWFQAELKKLELRRNRFADAFADAAETKKEAVRVKKEAKKENTTRSGVVLDEAERTKLEERRKRFMVPEEKKEDEGADEVPPPPEDVEEKVEEDKLEEDE
eukprot:Hpha_TRINITY_DN1840_c0_g1::TRINITY_DN1840_c0_g1_i1::g.170459::m.170459